MDISAFKTGTVETGLGLFLVVCLICWRLVQRKRYVLLLLWPVLIYFCGPTLTALFADIPSLGRYVFAESAMAETLILFAYVAAFYVADRVFDLSALIGAAFSSPQIQALARSPVFLLIYLPVTLVAIALQIRMFLELGLAITGGQYGMDAHVEGLIPYWGFLAGLYEIVFLFVVLFLLSEQRGTRRLVVVGAYVLAGALRLAGGTRLLLIKEIAVIVIIFYMQGKIGGRRLALTAAIVMVVGSVVGLLRAHEGGLGSEIPGPVFALVMESGLNALTFNIAYQAQLSGFIAHHQQVLNTIQFVLMSAMPTFLRFGVDQTQLDGLSPYNAALSGFDTYSPVGGMSGFATLCYLTSYPLLATLALVMAIGCLLRYTPKGHYKHILVVVFCINAIHFWRDPIDIAVKNFVQDVLCALVLLYIPAPRNSALTSPELQASGAVPA